MQRIGVYDDTEELIELICEELDITEPELVDRLLEDASENDEEIAKIYEEFYRN